MRPLRIVLVDDHTVVRQGLRYLLEREDDLVVVAEADNGRTAVALVQELRPDVVVVDITMPEMNGIEATRRIVETSPGTSVLVLSMHAEHYLVEEALRAGAKGFILKDCANHDLVSAIRTVSRNVTYVGPTIAGAVILAHLWDGNVNQQGSSARGVFSLSTREREVLQLLAEGKNIKEIGFILDLSIKTIETHRQNIMKKLNVKNVAEMTKLAIREGLTVA